jgi:predicted membrane metal-binding protein
VDGELLNIAPGQQVRICGQFSSVRPAQNPGEFDFARHARGDRQLCLVRADIPECVSSVGASSGASIRGLIDRLRTQGQLLLERHLSRRQSHLAAAMFLGLRDELDDELGRAFLETGTIHLLVV